MQMKKLIFCCFFAAMFIQSKAQQLYSSFKDEKNNKGIVYKGIINKSTLQSESAFDWFVSNKEKYKPSPELLHAFLAASKSVKYIVFGGTWCEDTQNLLPQFYKLQELTGMNEQDIVLFAVDRDKKTIDNITQAFHITNVPTIIVMKDGKEVGRVVEYGSSGNWDEAMTNVLK